MYSKQAKTLVNSGYLVVPILPGEKRPAIKDWQHARLSGTEHYPGHGVGIVCGQGAQPVVGIDIDISHPGICTAITEWCQLNIGWAPERVGAAPRRLLAYIAAEAGWPKLNSATFFDPLDPVKPSGKRNDQQIEVLGDGQQFVAYAIHPDVGKPYSWDLFAGGLDSVKAADLTVVTEDVIEELLAEFALLVAAEGFTLSGAVTTSATKVTHSIEKTGITLDEARTRIMRINNAVGVHYDQWVQFGMGLHHEFEGHADALALWDDWSRQSPKHVDGVGAKKWRSFGKSSKRTSIRWLIKLSNNVQKAIDDQARRDAIDKARREYQKQENKRIGEGAHTVPVPERFTLTEALERFVFLSDGSRVADIFNPTYDLSVKDWEVTYNASTAVIQHPDQIGLDGEIIKIPDETVKVVKRWLTSRWRKTVITKTFKAGSELILHNPQELMAINTWRPYDRSGPAGSPERFLQHIDFLFPDSCDRGRFLDWLAHIEQRPGELPHTAWLHIAKNFGLGRNWLASVLSRVWAGSVAANLDLVQLLKSGFNGGLSRKVLAVVDEIREGGRDSQWEHAEKLKSVITEETRLINPKYGRQSIEFNSCRWLMFSNHRSAIPMEQGDRRIEVVILDATPKDAGYYQQLYRALNDPAFIAGVAAYLGSRDLSGFNAGRHATNNESKQIATRASQSPMVEWCQMLLDHWPVDIITSRNLHSVLEGDTGNGSLNAAHRRTLEQFGIESLKTPVRVNGASTRLSILRNASKWKDASAEVIRVEIERDNPGLLSGRNYLMSIAAGDHQPAAEVELF